jgi:hypothetical protein
MRPSYCTGAWAGIVRTVSSLETEDEIGTVFFARACGAVAANRGGKPGARLRCLALMGDGGPVPALSPPYLLSASCAGG